MKMTIILYFNLGTSIPSKNDGKKVMKMTIILYFNLAWLSNIFGQIFKVDLPGPCTSNWQKGVNL